MHLLSLNDEGTAFVLTEFMRDNIPDYAILSHTWAGKDEEVTHRDMSEGIAPKKVDGYRKIQFCGDQARKDGLTYFWVDTCCIDKSSSSELTEAINSMFRWYQGASKCYVYLSDIPKSGPTEANTSPSLDWQQAFRNSRWFTRGWTLQELIGPRFVEFFDSTGQKLGDKVSLLQEVHEITRIPISVLQGRVLDDFSFVERKSWTEGRVTTLEEDTAYCLLGIFNVSMPLIYGEGRRSALRRMEKAWQDLTSTDTFSHEASAQATIADSQPARETTSRVTLFSSAISSVLAHHTPRSTSESSPLAAIPMWPGNFVRTKFTAEYLQQRDRFAQAIYYGNWDKVIGLLDVAAVEHGENWANVVRLRHPHEAGLLSFWTPLHHAAYLRAEINTIKHLIDRGALKTLRTRKTTAEFSHLDLLPSDLARERGHTYLVDILAPVIYHTVPHRTLARLQSLFHEVIRADWKEIDDVVLPELVALTELRVPEMWFPIGVQHEAKHTVGYRYKLDGRKLVVTKLGIESESPIIYKIE